MQEGNERQLEWQRVHSPLKKLKEYLRKINVFVNEIYLIQMKLHRIQFKDLKGSEGLVFLGCLNEWTNGIKMMLPLDCQGIFGEFSLLVSSGGRCDLVLPFLVGKDTPMPVSLIMWRLQFGDSSWISDYLVNYRDHHLHPFEEKKTDQVEEVQGKNKNKDNAV